MRGVECGGGSRVPARCGSQWASAGLWVARGGANGNPDWWRMMNSIAPLLN